MFRSLLALVTLVFLASAPAVADARGKKAPAATSKRLRAEQAQRLVTRHFEALAHGDADTVRALWAKGATVITVDGASATTTEALPDALARWIQHPDGLRWKVVGVRHAAGGAVFLHVEVTWNGMRFDDHLGVRVDRTGTMRLFEKRSTPRAGEPPSSGY